MILNNIFYAAGVLFYTKMPDSNVYFLLGKNYDNKWADFGGKAELSDKCDTFITASREAWEETIGCIYDYETLRHKIRNSNNIIISKTQSGKPYFMYVLYIPYSNSYREKFLSTKKFISKINIDPKFLEISDIKWVSLETIKTTIKVKPCIKLRNVFASNFDSNIEEITKITEDFVV